MKIYGCTEFSSERECRVTQIITRGAIEDIPPLPSLIELLIPLPATKLKKPTNPTTGYRLDGNGRGRCSKCLEPKQKEEFNSEFGLICKSCAAKGADRRRKTVDKK